MYILHIYTTGHSLLLEIHGDSSVQVDAILLPEELSLWLHTG